MCLLLLADAVVCFGWQDDRTITGRVNWYGCHANTEWYYKWCTFHRLKNRETIQLRHILICIVLTTWNVAIGRALNTFLSKRSYQTFRLLVASASCFICSWHSVHRAHGKHVRSHVWLPKPLHEFWLSLHNGTSIQWHINTEIRQRNIVRVPIVKGCILRPA